MLFKNKFKKYKQLIILNKIKMAITLKNNNKVVFSTMKT